MTERESSLGRLYELLADRATQGLDPAETAELDALRRALPDVDAEAVDRCAAVIDRALEDGGEPMPEALRERVRRSALAWMAARAGRPVAAPPPRRVGRLPWFLAAAGLLLAVVAWWPAPRAGGAVARRAALLAEAADVRTLPWQPNDAKITGDVVWSAARQEGYLRIAGLEINDPAAVQYQAWVFDARRPFGAVSGGVFDVAGAGEIVVPIAAGGVRVFEPALFAVTTEPPGGVLQHDPTLDPERFRIIVTAPAG
jgi:hypothetical protein